MHATLSADVFILTGLASRGGLSNWVFFFFPTEIVMCDLGVMPAVKAGAEAGVRAQLDVLGEIGEQVYGPQQPRGGEAEAWCAELMRKAKRVARLPCARVREIRLHLKAMAHELYVVTDGGVTSTYTLMNRKEAAEVTPSLRARFGGRFAVTTSTVFAFFERHAAFLMR